MLEVLAGAIVVGCCVGIPVAMGVLATLRKGKKEQDVAVISQDLEERHRE